MNTTQIRKVSVGNGQPDSMMHYQVNKNYNINGKQFILTDIILVRSLLEIGKIAYELYVSDVMDTRVKVLWKTLIDLPMIIENNISFD